MRGSPKALLLALALGLVCCVGAAVLAPEADMATQRKTAGKLYKDGNFKEAYEIFSKLALDRKDDAKLVDDDLLYALICMSRLNRENEVDAFREKVVEVHAKNWRLLLEAAISYTTHDHNGYMIAGQFERGPHRGGGKWVNAYERDRVRALQLMEQAMKLTKGEKDTSGVGWFYLRFAQILLGDRGYGAAWRLQYLSDLTTLPDYEEGYYHGYYRYGNAGAPVDAEGNPIFHHLPESYEAARSDGERWRWVLLQRMEVNPGQTNWVRMEFAKFLHAQFGVQTMARYGYYPLAQATQPESGRVDESGPFDVHTLAETETIARLATGVKRFTLPDEFNCIRVFQQVADASDLGFGEQALGMLTEIFQNRRQHDTAAAYWKRSIDEYGDSKGRKQKQIDQILGNWGRFEPVISQPAGKGATLAFVFRNGRKVSFEAHEINVEQLLGDIKAYLKSNPPKLDGNKLRLDDIGYRLLDDDREKYIGKQVAAWDLDLEPPPKHFDKRITITTPLQKPGAYLLTSTMADGNSTYIVISLSDTAIVRKPMEKNNYYYVADAVTGKPIAKANVEFFGYKQVRRDEKTGETHHDVVTLNFAESSDADGQVIVDEKQLPDEYNCLIIARTEGGRFAFMGFSNVWYRDWYDHQYRETKVYVVTDRPVYRPNQPVKFKFWVRHAQYDQENVSAFAGKTFGISVKNPKAEAVFTKQFTADEYGGFDGEFMLADEAMLGVYSIYIPDVGGGSFRVEEYKKPEFEVTIDAPQEPVMLGEKITATIKAKYYFGAPVTKATVKYKVLRYGYTANWYPWAYWDWFYGPGYWWFAYDYYWYPGWHHWGCRRPHFWWWPVRRDPPEVVMQNEVEIGPDGTVEVEFDTALAKAVHGDMDHRYDITAEVVDESRRTIVGQGKVLVARRPFKVYAWVDRGHYRVGDVVQASFSARTLDNKPVQGTGALELLRITYDEDNKPVETVVRTWELDTNDRGVADVQMKGSRAGQYRLSYKVTDAKDHTIEGGYIFVVRGEGFDGKDFRFNELELVTDKREYGDGDTVNLMINTDRVGSTVVLFVRPANGSYLLPRIIRMTGKSAVEQIAVTKKDMPNFFVEAFTVSDGRIYSEVREIIVPPEQRVLNVEVVPSAESYKPGEKAKVKVKLTDFFGEPFVGSVVMSVYDKSVEYISGGSNVAEIREFFWKWRRSHHTYTKTSIQRQSRCYIGPGSSGMGTLGVFGRVVLDYSFREERHGWAAESGRAVFITGSFAVRPGAGARGDKSRWYFRDVSESSVELEEGSSSLSLFAESAGPEGAVEPTVRTKFADTAFWTAALTTDATGMAEVEFQMPENLTGWKIRTWGLGHGTRVGEATAEVVTFKNLLLRMQAPRFFIEKDEVVLSANVHNYLESAKDVTAVIELDGECLELMGKATQQLRIDANGEERVDWRVKVLREGEAIIRMKALTDEESDAMEMRFPVYVHGMLKTESFSGMLRPEEEQGRITFTVPAERRIDESRLEVRYSPTLAGAMVDALPYLVNYPYGCTEQTLNRFLPTVLTQKILLDMGLDLKAIKEKRTNLNAQEIGDDVERAKQWQRWDINPVFDEEEVERMVKNGVRRLTSMQNADGGWGWFSGREEPSLPHMTATIVHGLQLARANGVAIVPGVIENGVVWLKRHQTKRVEWIRQHRDDGATANNLDAFVYMVLADADVQDKAMREYLYTDRNVLAVYAKAMFALALHTQGRIEQRDMLIRNIDQFLVMDAENQTAYLNLGNQGYWWYWYGSEYEAHAYYLKLLAATDPKSEKAPWLVKYLLNNRKHATYWNSTRDTAICVEAFADYLRATGELKPQMTVELLVDGTKHKEVEITPENLFTFDNKLVLTGDAIESGEHTLQIRKTGTGPLYFNAYVTNFTLEDFITKAGLEVRVNREVYKLVPVDKTIKVEGAHGQAVDQKVEKYDRVEIENLGLLTSGDLVEIELTIESKNDYEYIVIEDMKAAGFEPVELRSGYGRNEMHAYMELRDERVAFFVRWLARGKHSISYRVRAEIPGKFSALPTKIWAMYAPELKGNSDEIKLRIED